MSEMSLSQSKGSPVGTKRSINAPTSDQTPLLGDSSDNEGGLESDPQNLGYGSEGETSNRSTPAAKIGTVTHGRNLYVYKLTFLAAIGGFLFGYDTGVVSGAMIIIREEFDLNSLWQELVVRGSIKLIGQSYDHFRTIFDNTMYSCILLDNFLNKH